MKIINVSVPTIDEIKRLPAYQRKNMSVLCSPSTSLNYGSLAYVDKNGLISTVGKEYSDEDIRLEVEFQIEDNENISIGDVIEYNGVLFIVVDGSKAISLENISIPNLFTSMYSTSDPNKGNDLRVGYEINNTILSTWYEESDKIAHFIEREKYNFEEHTSTENELFSEIIRYTYQNQAEKEKRLYGKSEETFNLTKEKMDKELETPNIFVSELITFFIEAINNKYSIDDCAFYLLKQNKQFKFNVDSDNLSLEQQKLLKNEIQKIQKIYLLSLKYVELNSIYSDYLNTIIQKKNSQIQFK